MNTKKVILGSAGILVLALIGFGVTSSEPNTRNVDSEEDQIEQENLQIEIPTYNPAILNESEDKEESDKVIISDTIDDSVKDATITIQGNSDRGSFDNSIMQGFLAGTRTQMDMEAVKDLKPRFWRVGDFNSNDFVRERFPGVKTQIVLTDLYEDGGKTKPWKNWGEYEENIKSIVQYSKENSPIDYWDVWSEPDGLWTGNEQQFLEMIKRTHNAIRSVDQNAKIAGPSASNYDQAGYERLLDFLADNNLHFDAISWHEFGMPEELPERVTSMRTMINDRDLGPMEIQINEFVSGQNHLIPGWTAGWLYYLDISDVDWASRACWERETGDMKSTSECVKGLNGIFTQDEVTPQAIYWVHKFYSDMSGTKLDVLTSNPKIVALSSKDNNSEEIQILVGRYSCGQTNAWCNFSPHAIADKPLDTVNFEIIFNDYPYTSDSGLVKVTVEKIPFSYNSIPVIQPSKLQPVYINLQDNNITIPITNFGDGEVMRLLIESVE